jgi:predicted O-methyltransferase YrrM
MHFLPEKIDTYAVSHSQEEPAILKELTKETWQKVLNPRMLSGAFQGRLLSIISKLIKPKNILEIGTYTGYSTLCFAEGLASNGKIITIDKNEELETLQNKYFKKSGFRGQIIQFVGNALEIIPKINEKFDLVFIDADKSNYINYFHLIIDKMNSGGIILTDNVLWSGKVVEDLDPKDLDTKVLLAYNKLLNEDARI